MTLATRRIAVARCLSRPLSNGAGKSESMESPLNVPPELLRQADAIFARLIASPELLELGRGYGLRFGGAVMLADRYGEAGKRAAANMVELDY